MNAQKHLVTFSNVDDLDVEAVALSKRGASTARIMSATGLSLSQVTYRLTKAKLLDKLPRGVTFRTLWRDGVSKEAKDYDKMFLPTIRQRTVADLAPKIEGQSMFRQPRKKKPGVHKKPKLKVVRRAA